MLTDHDVDRDTDGLPDTEDVWDAWNEFTTKYRLTGAKKQHFCRRLSQKLLSPTLSAAIDLHPMSPPVHSQYQESQQLNAECVIKW